jgi:ABC-type transporter Mla subunit MlaD
MDQTAYDELLRRLVQVSERQDERMADMQSLLASLNTKHQRIDVTLIDLEQAMTQQTALMTQMAELLTRHEAAFERLGRLLDERLPPAAGNGR